MLWHAAHTCWYTCGQGRAEAGQGSGAACSMAPRTRGGGVHMPHMPKPSIHHPHSSAQRSKEGELANPARCEPEPAAAAAAADDDRARQATAPGSRAHPCMPSLPSLHAGTSLGVWRVVRHASPHHHRRPPDGHGGWSHGRTSPACPRGASGSEGSAGRQPPRWRWPCMRHRRCRRRCHPALRRSGRPCWTPSLPGKLS